jgi:hypothetical protein
MTVPVRYSAGSRITSVLVATAAHIHVAVGYNVQIGVV